MEGKTMTVDQLKPITDRLTRIYTCYQATAQVMNEHDPHTAILENLNEQFRAVLDDLDQAGVMS